MKKIAKPIIEISNIKHSSRKAAIEGMSLSVPNGDSFAVVCQKPDSVALILDIIAGKITPKSGKIFFKGDDVTGDKNNFGVVSSQARLPRKTVAELAAAPIVKRGLSRSLTSVLVDKELKSFGLSGIAEQTVSKLPEKTAAQAVLFAAYMCSHELMVIDEPFSTLAKNERDEEIKRLARLRREKKVSLLVFTKDVEIAAALADSVMVADDNMRSRGIIAVEERTREKSIDRLNDLLNN